MTCFLRVLRGIESEVDDSFTLILQYDKPQQDLLVTVKTNIASCMQDQLKYFVRGTKGSYVKVGTITRTTTPLRLLSPGLFSLSAKTEEPLCRTERRFTNVSLARTSTERVSKNSKSLTAWRPPTPISASSRLASTAC